MRRDDGRRHWLWPLIGLLLGAGGWPGLAQSSPGALAEGAVWHQQTPLRVPEGSAAGFTRLFPAETGVAFTNRIDPGQLAANQVLEVGGGVALGDVDGNGLPDLYLCGSQVPNRLYLNQGNWRFMDATERAGVGCEGQISTGAVFADVDGDGDLDLLVSGIGAGVRLFLNDGRGTFREFGESGLARTGGSTSMALADVDGDGLLDLYVANYHSRTLKDRPEEFENVRAGYVNGKFVITPPGLFLPLFLKNGGVSLFERGEADVFYRNRGGGRFEAVSWTRGDFLDETGRALSEPPKDWGLAAMFRDLNQDGAPDLYVCNDFFHSPDRIWINDGSGKFRAIEPLAIRKTSLASMAVDVADINRDGWDDLLVVDMLSRSAVERHRQRGSRIHLETQVPIEDPAHRLETPRNTLLLGQPGGSFAEIAEYAGLDASDWSWSVMFLDVDLDGFEDALIGTGNVRDANDADGARERAGPMRRGAQQGKPAFPRLEAACLAFRNLGDLTFREQGAAWGFNTVGVSHGMAAADLDGDGDLDVVVNHEGQAAGLYRNDSTAPRLTVRLEGAAPNTKAIGARIRVMGGATPLQSQEIICGGRYLSSDDPARAFAAGSAETMVVEVIWPDGTNSRVTNALPNHRLVIRQPAKLAGVARVPQPAEPSPDPWFEEAPLRASRVHVDPPENDWESQPLLPRRLSALGPGVAWRDFDKDGWEDFIVGAGAGGETVIYLNDKKGGFRPLRRAETNRVDQAGILGWTDAEGNVRLLIGQAAPPSP
jgi:hypothetical protein